MAVFHRSIAISIILALVLTLGNLFLPIHKASALLDTVYVDVTNGNDAWDGSSPTYVSDNIGPKQHIGGVSGGYSAVTSGNGLVYVAAGTIMNTT